MDEFFKTLYVHREDDYNSLLFGLKKYGNVIIFGIGGSGKTTLANYYSAYNSHHYNDCFYYTAQHLNAYGTNLDLFLTGKSANRNTLIVIDGFEQIKSKNALKSIYSLLKESKKFGYHIIIVSRPAFSTNYFFDKNTYKLHLKPLDKQKAYEMAAMLLKKNSIKIKDMPGLMEMIEELKGNALAISLAISLFKQKNYSVNEFRNLFSESNINYKNTEIEQLAAKPKIELIRPPEIIKDVKIINTTILEKIGRNPNEIYQLPPRQFEELVAELLLERGYDVTLTQQTRDGGKDLIIVKKDIIGEFLIYAECKRWAPHRPVGVGIVSNLMGRIAANRATAGMVVTSSYFSPDAQVFTKQVRHQMNLIDFVDLSALIKNPSTNIN